MSSPRRRPGGDDGPPRPRRDPATKPGAPGEHEPAHDADRTGADDRDAAGDGRDRQEEAVDAGEGRDREEEAVDAATAERLSGGVRRDVHGEYAPDPYPDEQDPGDTSEDVIEHHRQQAERIEHQPDVPRADE